MTRRAVLSSTILVTLGVGLGLGVALILAQSKTKTETVAQPKPTKPTPKLVQSTQAAAQAQKEIFQLSAELAKHNLKLMQGLDISDASYITFMKGLLEEPDIVDQLAAYGVLYRATKSFEIIGTSLGIDIRFSPREILEYIESH